MGVVVTGDNGLVIGGRSVADALTASLPQLIRQVVDALADHLSVYASLPREQLDGDIAVVVERSLKMFRQVLRSRCQPSEQELAGLRESAARQALLTDLLEGKPAEAAAQRASIKLPSWYLVMRLAIEEHADEASGKVNASVVQRRRLRRLRVELERQSSEPVLSMLTADGGIVLIPQSHVDWPSFRAAEPRLAKSEDAPLGPAWPRAAKLVESLASIGGTPVMAGAVATEPANVAAGAVLAKEILGVARAFGRPPGLYQLADLLVEYQLTRPSAAREQLASLLDPISTDADLVTTLRTFLDCGHNRQRAARLMHVHPNTVDYRLRKIALLTGLDATRPQDLPRIVAALAARDSVPA